LLKQQKGNLFLKKMENLSWLDRREYPFTPHYYSADGNLMHYVDEGSGPVILFVHGTPSWSFEFRHLIKELSKQYRCIAPDHFGFGMSDKPSHYNYSTQQHSKTLERFVLDHRLQDITLVVHDFGGPIGLNFALNHPGKIARLVILNTWLWNTETEPGFRKMKKILRSPILPLLYKYLNFSAKYLLPKTFVQPVSRQILNQYTKPFRGPAQRNGTIAFAKSLLNDQEWFEGLWNKKECIATKPILFIWGMKDPFINFSYLRKWTAAFLNSTVVPLSNCGHFPQEEEPAQVTKVVLEFLHQALKA
jgi:pimeloyl-ACP methyl ester carboxylesterase